MSFILISQAFNDLWGLYFTPFTPRLFSSLFLLHWKYLQDRGWSCKNIQKTSKTRVKKYGRSSLLVSWRQVAFVGVMSCMGCHKNILGVYLTNITCNLLKRETNYTSEDIWLLLFTPCPPDKSNWWFCEDPVKFLIKLQEMDGLLKQRRLLNIIFPEQRL